MTIPHLAGLRRRSLCVVALALCLCVIMQMLGASVTLLAAGDTSDECSESLLEGCSLTRMFPPLTVCSQPLSAAELP
jgi:hypothetical protein